MIAENPHPLVGHDDALHEVQAAFESGRMHHAWLIAGIEGIGKATLAKHIAQFVLATKGRKERDAKLVEAESHPDLLFIRRPLDEKTGEQKKTLSVDEARKAADFLHKTATHGGWRVVIVDEGHAMNANAQNAILKIIEEPPARTLILITVTTPGALLPTIRSRVRMLQLAPLDEQHMRAILHHAAPQVPPADITALIDLSGGSIGFALKILRTETLSLYREMLAILDAMPQMDIARLHKLADQIAKKADTESFEVLSTLLVERLRVVVHNEAKHEEKRNVMLALQIWDKTKTTLAAVDHANLDRKLAFINALSDIYRAVD